jgi:hypothetical protein
MPIHIGEMQQYWHEEWSPHPQPKSVDALRTAFITSFLAGGICRLATLLLDLILGPGVQRVDG